MSQHIQRRRRRVACGRAMAGAALLTIALATPALSSGSAAPPAQAASSASVSASAPASGFPVSADAPTGPAAAPATTGPAGSAAAPPAAAESIPARSNPVRLQIPAIDVDTALMELGLRDDGTLEVPPEGFPAGWFTGAPTPGELGPAIMAGHVDWGGQPGVFFDLRYLNPGDEVIIERADGSTAVFRVTQVERFSKDAFPTELVYGDIPFAGLRLITCGGSFDRQARSYVDNIVAFAELIRFGTA